MATNYTKITFVEEISLHIFKIVYSIEQSMVLKGKEN